VELDQLPPWLLREELYQSKAMLEDKLGCAVSGLAYPFGYSNTMVRMVARELGHSYGCAVGNVALSNSPDLFSLPRFTIRRSTGMSAFRQLVNGTHLARIFAKDRVLTKGWAIFRRSKAALKGGACVDWPEPPQ
jgi:hypothetical protein